MMKTIRQAVFIAIALFIAILLTGGVVQVLLGAPEYEVIMGQQEFTPEPTSTAVPEPTKVPEQTSTAVPPTNTPVPPTNTPVPPTDPAVPPTSPPAVTETAVPTDTPIPPTPTPTLPAGTSIKLYVCEVDDNEGEVFIYFQLIPDQCSNERADMAALIVDWDQQQIILEEAYWIPLDETLWSIQGAYNDQ